MATVDVTKPKGTKNAWTWEMIERNLDLGDEIAAGQTNHVLYYIAATTHSEDEHVDQVESSLENAPGGGKEVVLTVTNGVDAAMTLTFGAADTFQKTTTNNFDLDVSAQSLTISYTSTAGTTTGHINVHVHKHLVTIT